MVSIIKKMYRIIICSFFLCITISTIRAQAQSFYLIQKEEFSDSSNRMNSVTLSTKSLYGENLSIELFNLFYDKGNKLVLFSVLPTLSKHYKGVLWKKIDLDTLKHDQFLTEGSLAELERRHRRSTSDGEPLKRTDIQVVLQTDSGYVTSVYCLTEFFTIIKGLPLFFPNENSASVINTQTPMLSSKEMEGYYTKWRTWRSPNDVRNEYAILKTPLEKPRLFLSHKSLVGSDTAYHFWLFSDWHIHDGPNTHRGIDRFMYIPSVGIVGASFDYYFRRSTLPFVQEELLYKNYLEEKVMLPEVIHGQSFYK